MLQENQFKRKPTDGLERQGKLFLVSSTTSTSTVTTTTLCWKSVTNAAINAVCAGRKKRELTLLGSSSSYGYKGFIPSQMQSTTLKAPKWGQKMNRQQKMKMRLWSLDLQMMMKRNSAMPDSSFTGQPPPPPLPQHPSPAHPHWHQLNALLLPSPSMNVDKILTEPQFYKMQSWLD